MFRFSKKLLYLAIAVVIVLLFFLFYQQSQNKYLQLTFIDVGQGDAHVVRTPEGQVILIDGGPDRGILRKLGRILPWYERTIDLMILSHPHADHVTGLVHTLNRYEVKQVMLTGALHTTPEYLEFLSLIKDKKIPVISPHQGQLIKFAGGVTMDVFWPPFSYVGQKVGELNDTSIMNRVNYGTTSVLFTGDTPVKNEGAILAAGYNVRAQILKVAHQGSRTSSSPEFLKAVAPEYAVIPVGKGNRYGHPHKEVVERLKSLIPNVLRTDEEGYVRFRSDGKMWIKY